jgi:hypothetical protein
MFICDYRYKQEKESVRKPIEWFAKKKYEEIENFNSLGDCLSFLNKAYESGKNSYALFNWFVFDFNGSFYSGSFEIKTDSSFLELATNLDLSQFKK